MNKEQQFPLLTGQVSLDLINTEIVRHGTRRDLLSSSEDVVTWWKTMRAQFIFHDSQFSAEVNEWASEALPYLQKLRLFLRQGYERLANGKALPSNWINYLESLIEKAPFTYHIVNNTLVPVPIGKSSDSLIALIAFDAMTFFTTNKATNIRRCAHPDCVLLFVDTSGRRKWCSMKLCGNRKKVTRHQQRKKLENQ